MNGCRQQILMEHFKKHRIDWTKSNSVMAKELREIMSSTDIVAPEDLTYEPHGCPLTESNKLSLAENLENEKF